ncbi:Ig-like domain-containing protein [bacterium]|nr:Ig-like domain-containing protein [bacterium]
MGTGYDNYIWRIGVLGATSGDLFAFDNLSVASQSDDGGIPTNVELSVTLTGPSTEVSEPSNIEVDFSEPVTDLKMGDFIVTNGDPSELTGSDRYWSLKVTPKSEGEVRIYLAKNMVTGSASGEANSASNAVVVIFSEPPSTSLELSNGDLNLEVTVAPDTAIGNIPFSYDPIEDSVTYGGEDTGLGAGEWVLPTLNKGFRYDESGGAGGAGDGAMVQNDSRSFNQKPRAVLYAVDDNQTSTGEQLFELDVFFDEQNNSNNPLKFQVELYAWNDGQTAPELSAGGRIKNNPTYNVTIAGDSIKLLGLEIPANAHTNATWETVTLGSIDVETGYDNYLWRIGVLGATTGDVFAFDNLSVASSSDNDGNLAKSLSLSEKKAVKISPLPFSKTAFMLDEDNDGVALGLELALGTDPDVADSRSTACLALEKDENGNTIITFGCGTTHILGTVIIVERATDLQSGSFEEIYRFDFDTEISTLSKGITESGSANQFIVTDENAPVDRAFYRLRAFLAD